MSLPLALWDSSALIPLCVTQPQSKTAESLFKKYKVVAWWATEVEIRSGLVRLVRLGSIPQSQFQAAKGLAAKLVSGWVSAHESTAIANSACSLLEVHPLRAADALQLAAAFEVCEHSPRGFVFVTGDQRLAEAARASGFTVELV